jgi:hypothetical protein
MAVGGVLVGVSRSFFYLKRGMAAVFVDNPCKVDADTIIESITWSTCDSIAALATSRLDEKEKEKFQVLFVNDEVMAFSS